MIKGVDYYINDKGLLVFTEKYHIERGNCCGKGCLHCPYDYENVQEPDRTMLLNQKKKREQ
ncbi:MAG TPA: DUF5522 domain-containing protein [Chitinophagaceae bacterium]|nr:DUF5522 domain-containing protein [Chitinophagaceae bacterium]HMU58028.1 DUF5522 domain-containing protein [Chitinophagaceae bacterium]